MGIGVLETFRIAVRALGRSRVRSFLTTLGIIIGVGAVIAMVSIGEGAKARVEAMFSSMGTNLLVILPGSTTTGGVHAGFGSNPTLTWDDIEAIRNEVPGVKYVAPALRSTAQVISEEQNWTTAVNGVAPEYFDIRDWPMEKGVRFGPSEVEASAKVAILGQTVVERLYGPNTDPVSQRIRIRNIPFEVIGVAARKGQSPMGQDFDDAVFIPVSTYRTKIQGGLGNFVAGTIYVSTNTAADTETASRKVAHLLRDRHHVAPGQDDDFSIRNLTEISSAQQESTRTLTTLLAAIAAVSLLVGGIGIMNIMLVSVAERTREIGIRMAVGARPRDILAQFLVEALTLSLAGGVIGILLGLFAAQRLAVKFGWPTLIRPEIVAISVAFSAAVGVIFGLYPARRASQLDPIDALRYE